MPGRQDQQEPSEQLELGSRTRAVWVSNCSSGTECIEMRTYRDRYPYELAVSPHCNRLDNAPFPHSHISQCEPQEYGYADSVGVDEAHSGGEQTKVVLEDCSRRVSGI